MQHDPVSQVLKIGGEMVLASTRGRAGRAQMLDWSQRLREVCQELERRARAH